MIKILRNISKDDQLVMTTSWKQVVPAWEQFATEKADELIRNYKYLFEIVEDKEVEKVEEPIEAEEEEEEEEKVEKKSTKKFNSKK